jgi:hypothetical protein
VPSDAAVRPYHSGIDYVTPQQAHQGLRQKIVAQRRSKKLSQRRRRREENQKQDGLSPALLCDSNYRLQQVRAGAGYKSAVNWSPDSNR